MDPSTTADHHIEDSSSPAEQEITAKIQDFEEGDDADTIVNIRFPSEKFTGKWALHDNATLQDLLLHAYLKWPEYDWTMGQAIVEKRVPGFKALIKSSTDEDLDIMPLKNNSLRLMAPKRSTLQSMQEARAAAASLAAARSAATGKHPRLRSNRSQARAQEDSMYNFQSIRPLPYLPNPERSRQFLERLKADPGIRAAMRKHKFSVGLLTEMDPSQYTESNHEGTTRILGLNRNNGEVIELRLRTDAYDGYRDYRTIRKTLCHELAHNVHSNHDRAFWDLTHQIEREVHEADWKSGGRSVGQEEYRPSPEDDGHQDAGGWVGGAFTLGGNGRGTEGLSRREILARAAEERCKKMDETKRENPGGGSSGSS
ncbi:hypothetical protein OQA88_1977 [Cercophora sp. LCS_1]